MRVFDFDGTLLVFETRGLVAKKGAAERFPFKVGNDFYLEAGAIIGNKFYPKGQEKGKRSSTGARVHGGTQPAGDAAADSIEKAEKANAHFDNFIACVRSRKQDQLNAEIQEGHYSAALCHLGNISYRLGHPVPFDQWPQNFAEIEQVQQSLAAIKENLSGALGLDLTKINYQLGPKLKFDGTTEKFVGCPEADALLTCTPRVPFAVPEVV